MSINPSDLQPSSGKQQVYCSSTTRKLNNGSTSTAGSRMDSSVGETPRHRAQWKLMKNVIDAAGKIKHGNDNQSPVHKRDPFLDRYSIRQGGDSRNNSSGLEMRFLERLKHAPLAFTNESLARDLRKMVYTASEKEDDELLNPDISPLNCNSPVNELTPMQSELLRSKISREEADGRLCGMPFMINPHGHYMLIWLTVLTIAVLYNLWTSIVRQTFTELQEDYSVMWLTLDALADLLYLLDFAVQCSTTYLNMGLVVTNRRLLAQNYVKSSTFIYDLLSVTPLDLLQIRIGINPIIRFPRFLKLVRVRKWKVKIEDRSAFPNLWRVVNLIHLLLLGCHWFGCIYYMLSKYEKFEYEWGYQPSNKTDNSLRTKYVKCIYWAIICLTTIGIEENPVTNIQ